jgi:hypothetical protein
MRTRMISIGDAINSLTSNCSWSCEEDDYSTLQWFSEDVVPPTQEQVEAEIARLQAEQELVAYREQRASEYPDIKEYIDGIVKGDSDQVQRYIDECLAVKAKFPKPGE